MKKLYSIFLLFFTLCNFHQIVAQEWKSYTWEDYATTFKIPGDFVVEESSGSKFLATNERITLTIYPRDETYDNYEEMENSLITWAADNKVTYDDLTGIVELDEDKMNGYRGMLLEGNYSDFPVGMLLLSDPDYPDITLFIWVSYYEDEIDTVLEILQSFTPN